MQRLDIGQRVSRHENQIGFEARRDAAGLFLQLQQFGRTDRGRLQCLEGTQAELNQAFHLDRNPVDRLVVVVVVSAGREFHALRMRLANGILELRHHVLAPQSQHVVVLLLVHLVHRDVSRDEPGTAFLHQRQRLPGQVSTMLDAARASQNGGTCAFIAMRMHHHRQPTPRRLVDDHAQLTFRIYLLTRVGIRQSGTFSSASLDHIDASVGIDIHQQAQLIVTVY